MDIAMNNIVEKLLSGDSVTWSQFLFNIDMAKSITVDKNVANTLLTTGVAWSGDGWTTGSASKKLWETVKIPLVVPDFKEYLHVWLFALAMHWDIEVPALNLSAPAADASFQLLELLHRCWVGSRTPTPLAEALAMEKLITLIKWADYVLSLG